MKILISDYHVGCQLWQASLLENMGHEVFVCSFSGHSVYLSPEIKRINLTLPLSADDKARIAKEFDTVLVSFPPSFITVFKDISFRLPKILNCGHRLQIHTNNCTGFTAYLKEMIDKKEIIIGSMSKYDSEYIRHYLGVTPFELYVTCCHIPKGIYLPTRKEILIAPVHAHNITPFEGIDHMNSCAQNMGFDLEFSFVKSIYGNYTYDDIRNHKACVLFPYSAFSISMIELYELNIPMFVPCKELLLKLNLMNDVKLSPCYMTECDMKKYDEPHVNSPHKFSPNSYDNDATSYWIDFSYFYTKKNVILWDGISDLFEKLSKTNLEMVSHLMDEENNAHRELQKNNWASLLNGIKTRL